MTRTLATICLTLAALLGSAGMSWGADFQKGQAAYQNGDFATALREWKPLAEQGYARAQYLLGLMYLTVRVVLKNHGTAMKWYKLAAEQGNAPVRQQVS